MNGNRLPKEEEPTVTRAVTVATRILGGTHPGV
jgi:hypothetical protein